MKIIDIINYKNKKHDEIKMNALKIHPKIFDRITSVEMAFDKSYDKPDITYEYKNIIIPMIDDLNKELRTMFKSYIYDLLNDYVSLPNVDELGINLETGEYVLSPDDPCIFTDNFIPNIDVEVWFNSVEEILRDYNFVPFWKNSSYHIKCTGKLYTIISRNNAEEYIDDIRRLNSCYNSSKKSLKDFCNTAIKINEYGYEISLPSISDHVSEYLESNLKLDQTLYFHDTLKELIEQNIPPGVYTSVVHENSFQFIEEENEDLN